MSSSSLQVVDALAGASANALRQAAGHLCRLQRGEGFWRGDLTADSTLESDWFLLLLWLHPPRNGVWTPPDP